MATELYYTITEENWKRNIYTLKLQLWEQNSADKISMKGENYGLSIAHFLFTESYNYFLLCIVKPMDMLFECLVFSENISKLFYVTV